MKLEEKFEEEFRELEQLEKYGLNQKTEPRGDELQCPCCDYFTLGERAQYEICPICFWEDDGINFDSINSYSGPNHTSLKEARKNFKKFGACDSTMINHVLKTSERDKFKLEKRTIK